MALESGHKGIQYMAVDYKTSNSILWILACVLTIIRGFYYIIVILVTGKYESSWSFSYYLV